MGEEDDHKAESVVLKGLLNLQEIFESSIVALSESLVSGKTQDGELCSQQTKHNTRPEAAVMRMITDCQSTRLDHRVAMAKL